ncbi:HAMP domain-containing histidine kinase [Microbulbifer thermotolerans]|uniref:sensor histidine kinase n=1 Tax=Microbulbifer thermotolerans TaxID=252514 RepID=UPI00224A7DE3|nr:HAMP domain-containing sensor histidine kinase [Microbulbifer thermotolerans]MCX2781269.1 HAMP domain-containing histidine kinase [Microbulbifer thermotolerans]MCX2781738.1 HAMP domain-containing histidine kinase [Microbulbifer thermotolerans]MCX2806627.1 HAMP domain-containing histidine kinase [Microbulbifer thermotolerans]MCX2836376.1 HAMP domain-containing histidine kinase [Microbulbifer thermotolerans]
MKPRLSLKGLLLASFVSLGLILMAAYSIVSTEYFVRGLDASMANNMEKAARSFVRLFDREAQHQGREFSGFYLASDWAHMPEYVHKSFPAPPEKPLSLYKEDNGSWFRRPDHMVFLMRYDSPAGPLYIAREMTHPAKSNVVDITARQNRKLMVMITLLALGFVALISWLLLRHISRPAAALRAWTHSLDSDKLAQPIPDFGYPELNELAALIRSSLSSVQAALEREQRFLRHASHELRTPISTIRSNIELQRKLDAQKAHPPAHQATLDRIDRASLTMQHLTETLLWLNHQPDEPLQPQPVSLDALIRELAEEMNYLLTGKPVDTRIHTQPYSCNAPPVPARIILGNLIRNAYQHCWQGTVEIEQNGGHIVIRNPMTEDAQDEPSPQKQTGYGLGLELTEQLTRRLGWRYCHSVGDGYYQVELRTATGSASVS